MAKASKIEIADGEFLNIHHKKPDQEKSQVLIIMVHGFPGHLATHGDLYGDLEFILHDCGFHTLRFDFRGCGKSSGAPEGFTLRQARDDLKAAMKWARLQGYRDFIIIGEGLGCSVTMLNLGPQIKGLVMLWPALNLPFLAGHLPKRLEASVVGPKLIKELETIQFAKTFKEVVMPTLILHGSQDRLYPAQQLDLARKHMNSKKIEITTFFDGEAGLPALKHRKAIFYQIEQFLNKYA